MKINIALAGVGATTLPGYVNVDPAAPDGSDRLRFDPADLSPLAEANECEGIRAFGVLGAYPRGEAAKVLSHWASRLAHGGTLELREPDLREVARGLLAEGGPEALEEADAVVHGEGRFPRRSSHTLASLTAWVEKLGLRVLKATISDRKTAHLVAERP